MPKPIEIDICELACQLLFHPLIRRSWKAKNSLPDSPMQLGILHELDSVVHVPSFGPEVDSIISTSKHGCGDLRFSVEVFCFHQLLERVNWWWSHSCF